MCLKVLRLTSLVLGLGGVVEAFYIPGWSIKSYAANESIPLYVNKLFSDNTALQYAYYDQPFVVPPSGRELPGHAGIAGQRVALNLGEVLRGDRIVTSDYVISMGDDIPCRYLGTQSIMRQDVRRARDLVEDGYLIEWIVDNLPGATSFITPDKSRKYYAAGFKLGYAEMSARSGRSRFYINNHHTVVIRWRTAPGKLGRRGGKVIVGFEVFAKSIGPGNRRSDGCPRDVQSVDTEGMELWIQPNSTSSLAQKYPNQSFRPPIDEIDEDAGQSEALSSGASLSIPYTYSVYFKQDTTIEWSQRWDRYFNNQEAGTTIHWLAIINSLVISSLLTAVVVMVLAKTMLADTRSGRSLLAEEGRLKARLAKRIRSAADVTSNLSISMTEKGESDSKREYAGEGNGSVKSTKRSSHDEADTLASLVEGEDSLEDLSGWKLLHGDVFRAPAYVGLLAPLVGSGTQLVFMCSGLLFLSTFGLLNPSFRGGFVSVGMGLFIFAGMISGYFSERIYKTLTSSSSSSSLSSSPSSATTSAFPTGGTCPSSPVMGATGMASPTTATHMFAKSATPRTASPSRSKASLASHHSTSSFTDATSFHNAHNAGSWRQNAIVTALLVPGLLFGSFFILNLFVWAQASSTAIPFSTLVGLLALWLLIQLPLVYIGAWYAHYFSSAYEHATKTTAIPRQIPRQPWYTRSVLQGALLGGLIPFAVIFIELLFVFRSIWQDKSGYYYVFGFLSVVSAVNFVAVVEVTLVATYLHLCAENHHWWWQSIWTGAGSAVWVYICCIWFYWTKLQVSGFVSSLLFFCYCGLACAVYALLMGTVGFLTAYTFIRRIYGIIKAD